MALSTLFYWQLAPPIPPPAPLRAHELLLVAPCAVVEHLQRHIEGARIIAAVVKIAGRDLIGKLVRLDEIVVPEADRIGDEAFVDQRPRSARSPVRPLPRAEAAAGALLAFVGEDRINLGTHTARILYGPTVCEEEIAVPLPRAVLEISTVVVDDLVAQRRHPATRVEREKIHVVGAIERVIVASGDVVDPVLDIFGNPVCSVCLVPIVSDRTISCKGSRQED